MSRKSIDGSPELAEKIKSRRISMGLTIEEAAMYADVGTKTWYRYESGGSISVDKCKGIARALGWIQFPDDPDSNIDMDEYRSHELWSDYLSECYGEHAAVSFIIGSEVLLDYINEDLAELFRMPKGSHLGQLDTSFVVGILPRQFVMNYDYDFLYRLKSKLIRFCRMAHNGREIIAHSVLEEVLLYLIADASEFLMEEMNIEDDWRDWVFDVFGDADIETFLYSNYYMTEADQYHFSHWDEECFYTSEAS